jgi:L-alanine-DL-glutamate epimerase-like enolase superfamily enzyme
VDIALWDLVGKAQGKPVCELLGGGRGRLIRAYASFLFGETPDATAALARQAVEQGLTAVKFGWGPFGRDEETDVAHVLAARQGVGPWRDLMVDAGCKWDVDTALARAERLAPLRIEWLEEPLSQDDVAGYRRLCRHSPVPIAAGEGAVTRYDFEELISAGVHFLQPDVAFCGGLSVARQVGQLCQAAGRRAVPH